MAVEVPPLTLGLEEEYLLVEADSLALVRDPPPELMDAFREALGDQVTHEFLRCQLEVETGVCDSVEALAAELKRVRGAAIGVADDFGLKVMAASTHPFDDWHDQSFVVKDRYVGLEHDMKAVAWRLLICGMHVHVGIDDDDLRIDLMNQARYFLPHLLCLTASSPFWQGADTGLKCYRLTVFDSLPRTGLPDHVESWGEYRRMIDQMTSSELIEDGSKIWWDLRPNARYPTLEMRICDVCPRVEDAVTVAAMYQAIVRFLWRLRAQNQRWREYPNMLIAENRWLAQRYGTQARLVDFGKGRLVPFAELIDELGEILADDAEALGSTAYLVRAGRIAREGTSADRQLACYRAAEAAGAGHDEATRAVARQLVEDSAAELG